MKLKVPVILSVVLISIIYVISGRVNTPKMPSDLRDAPKDISAIKALNDTGPATEVEIPDIPKAAAQSSTVKAGKEVAVRLESPVPGLSQSGDIPLPSYGPDADGAFRPHVGYTEGGTFSSPVEKPEWQVQQSKVLPPAKPGELRVMEWNTSRGQKLNKLIQVIKKINPDVAIISEADMYGKLTGGRVSAREMASALGYSYYAAAEFGELRPDRLGSSGNAILSRYPLSGGRFVKLPIMKSDGGYDWADDGNQPRTGQRNSISAYIEVPGKSGKSVRINIVSLHTENKANSKVRLAQFEAAVKDLTVPGEPAILAGDLNTITPGEGGTFRNYLKKESFVDCSKGNNDSTFSAAVIVSMRLDWVILQPGADNAVAAKSYQVGNKEGASDHSPIITEFQVN